MFILTAAKNKLTLQPQSREPLTSGSVNVYRKVLTGLTSPTSNTEITIESGIESFEFGVLCRALVEGVNTLYQSNYYSSGGYMIANFLVGSGQVSFRTSLQNSYGKPMTLILEYTKTTDIAGFSWWSPKMAADNVPSPYGAFASSDAPHYGSNGVYAAFDNDPDTFWSPVAEDTSNNYIGFDFGAKTLIKGIRILPRKLVATQCPVSGTIEGSGDGTTWSEIEVFSNGAQVEGEYQTHMFDPVSYRYYRISHMQGTYKDGPYYVSIANIEFLKGGYDA